MIVAGVSLILLGIVSIALVQMKAIFYATDTTADLQASARHALKRLGYDLRRADARDPLNPQGHQVQIFQNSPEAGTDSITYHLPRDTSPQDGEPDVDANGNLIWDATAISVSVDTDTRQLMRNEAGAVTILANNVERLNCLDHTIDAGLSLDTVKLVLELNKITAAGRAVSIESTVLLDLRN